MIKDYVDHFIGLFKFVVFIIIPALILTPLLIIRDLILHVPRPQTPSDRHLSQNGGSPLPHSDENSPSLINDHLASTDSIPKPQLTTAAPGVVTLSPQIFARTDYPRWVTEAMSPSYFYSIPRRVILSAVCAFACLLNSVFNRTTVHNLERLKEVAQRRPAGTPLLTISNHKSTLDDPLMWGIWSLRASDPNICRWTLTAKDMCFFNPYISYFFRLGKCLPVDRWGTIKQGCFDEAVELLKQGEWLHMFPEGKILQDDLRLQRMKWGVASVIARCEENPPIIMCIAHSGFEKVTAIADLRASTTESRRRLALASFRVHKKGFGETT
eukprot:TRINITY_DN954_c0_g2_i2.p1 TRINITY_DN954_c0_g2~~TRINITY_DN954_c0_g2_i2.p1  ORF type:complete len:326 (-),score=19.93 TRINITY_DN954_c0_g2_i2:58-1035(-)